MRCRQISSVFRQNHRISSAHTVKIRLLEREAHWSSSATHIFITPAPSYGVKRVCKMPCAALWSNHLTHLNTQYVRLSNYVIQRMDTYLFPLNNLILSPRRLHWAPLALQIGYSCHSIVWSIPGMVIENNLALINQLFSNQACGV